MGLISLLFSNPLLFLILVLVLLYSVILHEVAHGLMALHFGDDTAFRNARLTLNPASHLDPMGTLMLFLVGFGWAKPVPVDYYLLKNKRFALFSVALAGCATNIIIAIIALTSLQFKVVNENPFFGSLLPVVIRINIILGAFNLIPLPPLDGSKVLLSFLPEKAQTDFARIEPYGFLILIFLLFTGLLNPLISLIYNLILGLISLIFGLF